MNRVITLAYFDHEHDVLEATAELRRRGVAVADVYSPHAIHGIDEALGIRPSRLTWVCFVCGLAGAVGAFWFQHWANAVDWPINVGGKPWNSMPAETPVAFEMMVLLAAFGSVAAMFLVCRLFPGKSSAGVIAGATDDRYVMALSAESLVGREADTEKLLYRFRAQSVERRIVE